MLSLVASVEVDGGTKETVDHVGIVVELLMHHQREDTHHSRTTVVQLTKDPIKRQTRQTNNQVRAVTNHSESTSDCTLVSNKISTIS